MDLRARLAALLAILSDEDQRSRLTDAELGEFHAELAGIFASVVAGEVDDVSPVDTEFLSSVGDCLAATCVESGARFSAADAANVRIREIAVAAGLEVGEPEGSAEGEGGEGAEGAEGEGGAAAEGEGGEGEEGTGDAGAEGEGAEGDAAGAEGTEGEGGEGDGIQASGAPRAIPTLRDLNSRTPRRASDAPRVVVGDRLGADVTWVPTNERITFEEFFSRLGDYPQTTGARVPVGEKLVLGKVDMVPATAQRIDSRKDSPESISAKLDAAVAGALDPTNWDEHGRAREALVASGGWGAPAPVVYDLEQLAVADRPVFDGLPSVVCDRGGLMFVRPPLFTDVTQGGPDVTTAAVGIWDAATDLTPGELTKSHQRVPTAPAGTIIQLDAIYRALELGVFQSRAFPEWVRAWEANTNAAWAQTGETHLLDLIEGAARMKDLTSTKLLSGTRDVLASMTGLAAAERRRQRMRPDAMVRVLYPTWLLDLVQMDLVRAGTNFVDSSPMLVARSYLNGQLRAANINASDYYDSSTEGGQLLPAQNAGVLAELPGTARWYMWHEGMFVAGTQPTLDLGIVRDADLVDTNDYRLFAESFETIFDRGLWAYQVDQEVCANGAAAAAIDIHTHCDGS